MSTASPPCAKMLLPVLALRQHFDEEGVLIAEEPLNFARVDLHRHARIVAPLWMAAPYRPDTKRCFAKWALEDSNLPPFPRQGSGGQRRYQRFRRSEVVRGVTGVPLSDV
jgi:hypothetical protein